MTKDEALKLALETLEYWDVHGKLHQPTEEAITAIKEALAQPEQKPVDNGKLKVTLQDTPTEIELAQYKQMFQTACADLGAINDALGLDPNDGGAEPILFAIEELKGRLQEPVATVESVATVVSESGNQEVTMSWWHEPALPVGTKLYTTPPQRTWVGLTDEEVDECYYWKDRQWTTDELVRHVEAKLKERNT